MIRNMFEGFEIATATPEKIEYDWVEDNKTAVRSLRSSLAARYMKEGLTRSRATIKASDEIASTIMRPAKTGQELDTWLAPSNADRAQRTTGAALSGDLPLSIKVEDEKQRRRLRGQLQIEIVDPEPEPTYAEQVEAALKRMSVGQRAVIGPMASADDLRALQSGIASIVRRVWPRNGHTPYKTSGDPDKLTLTITRL